MTQPVQLCIQACPRPDRFALRILLFRACQIFFPSSPGACSQASDYFAYNWGYKLYKSRHHLIKRLQTLERLELLVGVQAGLKNEVTQQVRDLHRRQTFWTELLDVMLAGSTPMTEIICEYLSFTRLSKLLAYSEITGIPLDECPALLSFFFSFWIFM